MAKNKLSKLIKAPSTGVTPSSVIYSNKPTAADKARERRYAAEDNLRTITRAKEIMCNSAQMRDVKALAQEQMKTLRSVVSKRK